MAGIDIGTQIKRARKLRGWSQNMLADTVGVVQNTISYWETGRSYPTVTDLVRMGEALGVPANILLRDALKAEGLSVHLDPAKAERSQRVEAEFRQLFKIAERVA